MDNLEREFKKILLDDYINVPQFNVFKSSNPRMYEAILFTLRKINNKHIDSNMLTLDKLDIKKLNLKIGKPKVFIFCGVYILKGSRVILLELIETIGTYYLKDSRITRQLINLKIGEKIGLEMILTKEGSNGVTMTLPYESTNIGLFGTDEEIKDGKHL